MYPHTNRRRYVGIGLAVMLLLIGVATVIWALTPHPVVSGASSGFGWPFGLFGLFFLLWFVFAICARPWRRWWWGAPGYGPYGWRGYGYRRWGRDPALEALRERYARGELTKEPFDGMMRDLSAKP